MTISTLLPSERSVVYPIQTTSVVDVCHDRELAGFNSFAALPSNIRAIEAGLLFANGMQQFVALFGPSGWGKTHLLQSVGRLMSRSMHIAIEPRSALDWALSQDRHDNHVLLLDDSQDVLGNPRAKHQLRQALERRVKNGRPTFLCFTGPKPVTGGRSFLPSSRDWGVTGINEPSVGERELVVRQIASNEGLFLAKPVIRLIARHLHGNGRSILGALQRMSLVKSDWSRSEEILPACGILSPYLIGRDGWDARDEVYEAVEQTLSQHGLGMRGAVADVTAYLLLNDMGLSEGEVASFLKETPSKVYTRAAKIRQRAEEPMMASMVGKCRDAVVAAFESWRL